MIPPATCNRAAPVVIYHQCEANLQFLKLCPVIYLGNYFSNYISDVGVYIL